MLGKVSNLIKNPINRADFVNKISSPGMAKYYVAGLVGVNGTTRIWAAETDKKEKPAARHYAAAIAGLQEGFALTAQFLLTPLFAIGGLYAGKKFLAKKAFAKAEKIGLDGLQKGFLSKADKNVKKSALSFLEPVGKLYGKITGGLKKTLGLENLSKNIEEIKNYNRIIQNEVRSALDKGKNIVIQTGESLYRKVKDNNPQNILDALENKPNSLGEEITSLAENQYAVPMLKQIGGNEKNQKLVLGSEGLGEALGMMTALTIISPMFSIRLVPVLLKKLGLSKEKVNSGEVNPFEKIQPKFNMAERLHQKGFNFGNY